MLRKARYVTDGGRQGVGLRVCLRGWAGEAGEIWERRGREGEPGARWEMDSESSHSHMTIMGGGIT